jgi:peroxiredoxin
LRSSVALVLLLCLPAIFIVHIYRSASSRLLRPGDPVPALTARDLLSNRIDHFSFKNTPAALLFFSADCPHCQRELANFNRLNKRFGDEVLFLAISMSTKEKTAELIRAGRLDVKAVLDEENIGQERFGVDAVPALFLVGTDETIVHSSSGEKTFAADERLLMEFINSSRSAHN